MLTVRELARWVGIILLATYLLGSLLAMLGQDIIWT